MWRSSSLFLQYVLPESTQVSMYVMLIIVVFLEFIKSENSNSHNACEIFEKIFENRLDIVGAIFYVEYINNIWIVISKLNIWYFKS